MINQDAIDRLAAAMHRAHDPVARFSAAVSAVYASTAGEVRMHAERRRDGTLLRLSTGGRSVEVVLDAAACRNLAGYLTGRS